MALGLAACGGRGTLTASAPAAGPATHVRTAEVVRSGGAGELAVPGTARVMGSRMVAVVPSPSTDSTESDPS